MTATTINSWDSLVQFFWSHVDKNGPNGCWIFRGSRASNGYGRIVSRRLKIEIGAHRVSWIVHNGKISGGLFVCHTCDNRPCCNPSHLFLGNHADNSRDMVNKNRQFKPTGVIHGMSKLTDGKVVTIRKLWKDGNMNQSQIASMFNITQGNVSCVVLRKTWSHI